jgi:uncharacterized coiled-coil protein SlyX
MLNLKIYAILAVLALAAGAGFKVYFDYSQEQIATLTKDITGFRIQNEAQTVAFDTFKNNIAEQTATITELNKDITAIKNETSQLSKTLARHELDKLASAKPETLKRLANAATKKVFRKLETASKPLEKKE